MVMVSFLGLGNFADIIYNASVTFVPLQPWINWDYVHGSYDAIGQFPRAFYTQGEWNILWLNIAEPVVGCIIVFFFYGTGGDAMKEYAKYIKWIQIHVLREPFWVL